jgi:hypothetical protein
MAETKNGSRSGAREVDGGAQAAVTPGDAPKLIVEILDDVEGFVDGKAVKPGDQVKLDMGTATNLVMLRHGKIVGSE